MPHPKPLAASDQNTGVAAHGDPWQAFGYVVAGVLVYGGMGFALDRWWGTSFMVALGILAGAGLGIYMTFGRFGTTPVRPEQD